MPALEMNVLQGHVAQCPLCLEVMRSVTRDDLLVETLRAGDKVGAIPREEIDEALVARLCRLHRGPGLTIASSRGTPSASGQGMPKEEELAGLMAPPGEPDELGRIGPYGILRVLGSGGMGVVFAARQERPRRVVALKMILSGPRAGRPRLERFRDESEIIARLRHPNIIQVHEVGEHDGWPYFTMEHADGGSLAQQLAAAPLAPRTAAELVQTLARAVHCAHEQGIVHRDLKPSNVLLATDGTPRIADFGLAKQLHDEPGVTPPEGRTETGVILGTPGYMAPEQAGQSQMVGPAADIYALGAILYESLTGRPPFRAATVLETLDQLRAQEPVPPARLQPTVPRDLQTICLQCLEKAPPKRYASASELADDLRRFLAGEPIRARPVGPVERLCKWARRRPALAAVSGLVCLVLTGLVAGAVVYEQRLKEELAQTEAERERADANYREARTTLRRMLEQTHDPRRGDLPKLRELRQAQQEEALKFFLTAAQRQGSAADVRADVAEAHTESGRLQYELGRLDDARQSLDHGHARWAALAAEFPEERRYRAEQAECLALLGSCQQKDDDGVSYQRQALALRTELVGAAPMSVAYRAALATSHDALASSLWKALRGDFKQLPKTKEIETHFLKAEEIRAVLAKEQSGQRQHRWALANIRASLSVFYQNTGRPKEMDHHHDLAEEALERLVADDPLDYRSLLDLAQLRVNWAYLLPHRGRTADALANLAKSVPPLEEMVRQEPAYELARDRLLNLHGITAKLLESQQRHAEAALARQRVVELSRPGDQRQFHRLFLALAHVRAGRHAEGVREAEALTAPSAWVRPHAQFTHLAKVCAAAITTAQADSKLDAEQRHAVVEEYAAKALAFLKQARTKASAAEWNEVTHDVRTEADFRPLREREEFRQLLKP
jgi:tetratricopeptide (TPR) repeat protein